MRRPWLVLISRESIQGRSPATASASAHLLDSLAGDRHDRSVYLVAESTIRTGVSVAGSTLSSSRIASKEELCASVISQMVASHANTYSAEMIS
jgi:hypothetical protein